MDTVTNELSTNTGQIKAKWGDAVGNGGLTGFLAVPEVLIRGQHRLGITSIEMMVLMNVLMHWWYEDRKPFPGNHVIAKRMGVSQRTVQRAFRELEEKKIIKRHVRRYYDEKTNARHSVREIDLEYLVFRLHEIAEDLRKFNQANKDGGRTFKRKI